MRPHTRPQCQCHVCVPGIIHYHQFFLLYCVLCCPDQYMWCWLCLPPGVGILVQSSLKFSHGVRKISLLYHPSHSGISLYFQKSKKWQNYPDVIFSTSFKSNLESKTKIPTPSLLGIWVPPIHNHRERVVWKLIAYELRVDWVKTEE